DARILGPRVATLLEPGAAPQLWRSAESHGDASGCATLHRPPFETALVDASVHLLGLPSRDGDYLSAGLRMDIVRQPPGRSDGLRHVPVRVSRRTISHPHVPVGSAVPRAGH